MTPFFVVISDNLVIFFLVYSELIVTFSDPYLLEHDEASIKTSSGFSSFNFKVKL